MSQMVELEEEKQAQYSRVENEMVEFYRETREQTDTLGMSMYMWERLSNDDFKTWKEQEEQAL